MGKKTKSRKLLKRARKAASPGRALLMGALGGAAVMWFGRDQLRAGYQRLRTNGSGLGGSGLGSTGTGLHAAE